MPNQKVVLTLQLSSAIWTEQFYMQRTDPRAAAAAIDVQFTQRVISWRHPLCWLAGIRVSDVDQPRQFVPVTYEEPTHAATTLGPDNKNTDVVWQLRDTNNVQQRPISFRGLIDADITRDPVTGSNRVIGGTANGILDYISDMNRIGACIRSLVPIVGGDANYDWYAIDSVAVDTFGNVTLHSQDGTVHLPANNRVILSRFSEKQFAGLNGRYTALSVTSPTFKVRYHSVLAAGTYVTPGARYREEVYRYGTISPPAVRGGNSRFVSISSRNTRGGPFGFRGRRRSKVSRSQ